MEGRCILPVMDPWAPADPLGEALRVLRMNGAYYCRSELTAPWGLALPPMPGYLWFHVVDRAGGSCSRPTARAGGWLDAGDLALVPRGTGHGCAASAARPRPTSSSSSASRSPTATRCCATAAAGRRRR